MTECLSFLYEFITFSLLLTINYIRYFQKKKKKNQIVVEKDTTKVVILELLQKVPLNSSHNLSTTITLNNSHIMFVQF